MNRISKLLNQDIPYLDSSKNKLIVIGFICLYSFIFIKIYDPYDINVWGKIYYLEFVLLGLGVFLVSQFILRPLFKIKRFKVYSLMLWGLMEMLLIAAVFELVYSPPINSLQEQIVEYFITVKQIVLVVVVPYTLFLWYTQIQLKLSSYKQVNDNTVVSNAEQGNELLVINGDNNKVLLAIKYPKLLYIKSAGNYLELFYLTGEKLTRELVRMSFKELEPKISDPNVIRIHRSYMINTIHIASLKKTKKGYGVRLQNLPEEVIPVSSGYKDVFERTIE